MKSPEMEMPVKNELPPAQEAAWHEFLDPHKAAEDFKKLLRELGEAI